MYPVSSKSDRKKNSVTISGRKLMTLPTPAKMPSSTRDCTVAFTSNASNAAAVRSESQSTPDSNNPWKKAPITLKVK